MTDLVRDSSILRDKWELLLLTSLLLAALPSAGCRKAPEPVRGKAADWPHYGRDEGGSRYSPLDEITPRNVEFLQVAWTYRTGDVSDGEKGLPKSAFEATPLLIDGTLYVVTPMNRIIALDPETSAHRWTFDPKPALTGDYGDGLVCRGLASWRDSSTGRLHLYMATQDGRLVVVDGKTGEAIEQFGSRGEVDLKTGIVIERVGEYHFTSPPAVARDTVVVGSAINDNNRTTMPSGVVRGFDARTGALLWAWDPVPKDPTDPAHKTWESDAALRTGAGNAWAPLSADSERDLVFVPTGSASVDHYGGERKGANVYADSVVALRGSTGKVVWYFQTVHHNVWDYDVPAQPTLITLQRGGREIPALAQATKVGHLFVLHRETGEPLFPVEERPVPQTDVPGERTHPTQPFPVLPPALTPQDLRPEDAWGLTPWDRRACRNEIAGARNEGVFTPPSLRGTLVYPGLIGGTNWGSVAFDPGRQLLVLNNSRLPFIVRLLKRDEVAGARKKKPDSEIALMRGTPYAMQRYPILSPLELPCSPPPWGTILAVDLRTGQKAWESTLGTIRDLAPVPLPIAWGTPSLGGPMMAAGGVTFIAAAMDNYLRAFNSETGEELWKARLPAGAQATPMTYRVRDGGRQFVVIAAGGHGKINNKLGDYIVAFALP